MPRSGRVSRRAGAKLTGRPVLVLDIGPLTAQHDAALVTRDGRGQEFDAKLPDQEFQSLLNPGFGVIEVLARDHILATEESLPHHALGAVIDADFRFFNQVAPRQSRHGLSSTRILGQVAEVSQRPRYRTREKMGGPFRP